MPAGAATPLSLLWGSQAVDCSSDSLAAHRRATYQSRPTSSGAVARVIPGEGAPRDSSSPGPLHLASVGRREVAQWTFSSSWVVVRQIEKTGIP